MKTVTIGIPAYNEENTIKQLLVSILNQRRTNFSLQKIIVLCDGSSDKTPEVVTEIAQNNSIIECMSDGKRLGKCSRLNQVYEMNQSDFLITLDADIVLANNTVIEKLLFYFQDNSIGLVSGNGIPSKAENFTQHIINNWYNLWYCIRKDYKGGDVIHNIHGNMSALRKNLSKLIVYPKGITSDQDFLFMSAKKNKIGFHFAKDATFYVRNPDNIHDFYLQASRFSDEKEKMVSLFGNWIKDLYYIPIEYKIKKMVLYAFSKPVSTVIAACIYAWFVFTPQQYDALNDLGMWKEAKSTKKAISITTSRN